MGIPAVQVKDIPGLATSVTGPVDGVGGFVSFVGLEEPLSVGVPPVTPTLVERVTSPAAKREVRTAGGDLTVRPLAAEASARREVLVSWGNLTVTQRVDLTGWLRDVVWGGRFSFNVKLDGLDSSESIKVRLLDDWEAVSEGLRQEVVGVRCEEIR